MFNSESLQMTDPRFPICDLFQLKCRSDDPGSESEFAWKFVFQSPAFFSAFGPYVFTHTHYTLFQHHFAISTRK